MKSGLQASLGQPAAIKRESKWRRGLRITWPLHLLVLPATVIAIVFHYLPIFGLVMAFQDYKPWLGFFQSEWVGFKHFESLFMFDESVQVIWNTLIISVLKIVFGLFVPIVIALLLNEIRKSGIKRSIQTLVYLPHFLSWVILGGILIDLLSVKGGIVNRMLVDWFDMQPIFFLGDGDWFRFVVVVSDIWKEFGFAMIIYLAAIAGVNPSLYEAAEVDGATRLQQTINVTMPAMLPIIVVVATLQLGNVLNAGFDQIFNLYNPLVYNKGDVIDTFVYRSAMLKGDFSFATAVGLFKSIISFILIIVSYRLAYRLGNYRIF
ncbi:ABC transporter permease subunit [Paenibacillus sp. LHD-117]|uniref:ABC transporter permease n=1 Tax=unclassified Paenibacillus TaxID=185978 RepID=UPI0027E0E030|nr:MULTISPECIES: ABC transporter permease subunit [unclassified Paenibacillus]MDQ6419679.1 ABC transporter permease subunit [Paenibacillus sp. LHD-117]MDQ8736418.1 ABC transporter permease subunit [Paenibacillus sp. LHD-38]